MMAHKQRSKSTSSIPTEQDVQQEIRNQAKEIEEQWRDDLARWKSHRRSVHCNMVREREEHERAELAGGGSARKPDTRVAMQGGEREAGTPASHRAASFHTPQAIGFKLQPRSISLPPRSYIANSPYAPAERAVTPPAIPHSTQARTSQEASLSTSSSSRSSIAHTDRTRTDLKGRTGTGPDIPIGATAADRTGARPASRTSTAVANVTALSGRTGASLPDLPGRFPADPSSGGAAEGSGAGSAYKAPDPGCPIGRPAREKSPGPSQSLHSMDTKPAAAQVTAASLPGSSRRSGSSRLASVVSPRPFGTQSTKISPVSRAFTMDDSCRRFNGETNLSQNSEIADHQHPFLTPEDEARSQPGSMLINNEAEPGSAPFHSPSVSSRPSCDSSHSKMASAVPSASEASFPQTRYEDIRIRLSQRTDSTQDFGFQTSWQSTGILIKSIQQGSPAELCHLQVGDAIVAVDGCRVSEMSCEQWKASLDSALQQGSLVLDVRRNGESGSPEQYTNASNEVISCPPLEDVVKSSHTFNSQAITDVDSKDMNGRFHPESMESKESQPLSLKNLKRRSEFFEQPGGSESAISDIRIPSISTSSTRHSWDPQEERKRQEKWQQEQERLLQEKYKRDQQKLEEEWRRAQQDAVRENSGNHAEKHLEVDTRSLSPLSPASPLSQATPPPSEEPSQLEDGDELEETLPQGAEPCKEELERMGQGEELGLQRNCEEVGQQPRPEEEEERKMCQQVTDTCPREQEGNQEQDHWEGDGFAKIHPEISLSDRAKSKSTPELDEVDNPEVKVVAVAGSSSASKPTTPPNQEAQKKKKKKNRPLSQVEMDRLQILEEMKKKTQLLTDSSWIRQRTTNIYKEPIHLGGGMRRYESLDNLNTARSWRQSPWPPSPAPSTSSSDRPQSAASNSASPHSYTRSISSTLPSSFSMGSLRQSPWSQPSPTSPTPPTALNEESSPEPEPRPSSQRPSRSVSGRRTCNLCGAPLGRGTAMLIESLGLCFHLGCFKVRGGARRWSLTHLGKARPPVLPY
ncbi:LIM domain only protein 7-like isoform X2 [Anguilla rostrata]|uniref:LIM domain only protein 7-like isoform X2 n=1 Tax=Anguilla rostrata TaxID=7938 RepID=UPI0030D32122